MFARVRLLCLLAPLAVACGARSELSSAQAPAEAASDAALPRDASDASDVADVADVADAPDARDVLVPPEPSPLCLRAGTTNWQVHHARGPICFGESFSSHGDPRVFAFEPIPPALDPGWLAHPEERIDFERPSTLCGTPCSCHDGGDFTFFQTFFDLPAGFELRSFEVFLGSVDDGARVTIFNARFPDGTTDPSTFVQLGQSVRVELRRFLVAGRNRLVVSHVDTCCSETRLRDVRVLLNDGELVQCP